jgi:hypothetical protein
MQDMKNHVTSRLLASAGTLITLVMVVGAGRKWS